MGASGSGKSSLLGAICGTLATGLQFLDSVLLDGQRIDHLPTESRRVGIPFQEALLFAVAKEAPGWHPGKHARQQARHQKVHQGLQDIEMLQFANTDPATLAGGQRARVALMRALLAEPKALLLDETFSKFDSDLRIRLRQFVFQLVASRNLLVLLITHDDADIANTAYLTQPK